jgi:hypothetical protein
MRRELKVCAHFMLGVFSTESHEERIESSYAAPGLCPSTTNLMRRELKVLGFDRALTFASNLMRRELKGVLCSQALT